MSRHVAQNEHQIVRPFACEWVTLFAPNEALLRERRFEKTPGEPQQNSPQEKLYFGQYSEVQY